MSTVMSGIADDLAVHVQICHGVRTVRLDTIPPGTAQWIAGRLLTCHRSHAWHISPLEYSSWNINSLPTIVGCMRQYITVPRKYLGLYAVVSDKFGR